MGKRSDKREYKRLIRAVRKLRTPEGEKAASYLEQCAISLKDFTYTGDLMRCITWSWTLYGKQFWQDIENALIDSGYYKDNYK